MAASDVPVAPGVRLEVLDWDGDGIRLVFIAGANFAAPSFDNFAPRFADTHRGSWGAVKPE